MSQSLGSLFVELKAETGAFVTGMSKASYAAKQASKDIQSGFDSMGNAVNGALGQFGAFGAQLSALGTQVGNFFTTFAVSGNALGVAIAGISAIGAAGIAAAAGLAALAISGAELVERLSNISQKTGISIRDLQTFEAAGKTVGVSLDDMVTAMRKFDQGISGTGKGAGAAALVLQRLGITSHDNKTALLEAADAFAKMPDGVQKATDAVVLFGKSGLAMIPFLNKGRDGVEEFSKMVAEYGPNIDANAIAANEKWQQSTEALSLAWDRFKVNIVGSVLPTITSLVSGISDATKGIGDLIAQTLKKPGTALRDYFSAGGGTAGLAAIATGAAADNAPKSQSAQEIDDADTLRLIMEQTAANQKIAYEQIKAGSAAAYALEQQRAKVAEAVAANDFEDAATLQKQIPALEDALAIEKERTAEAKKFTEEAEHYIAALFTQQLGGETPLFNLGRGAKLHAEASGPAPDISGGPAQISTSTTLFGGQVDAFAESAKAKIADFYSSWGTESKKSEDDVNETYDGELKTLQGYFALGIISQQTFSDASIALEKSRATAIQAVWKSSNTFADQFKSFFVGVGAAGQDVAKSFFADMQSALDSLNSQLAKFVVTGKGLNFRKLGQGLEENLASTGLKKVESLGANALGGLFGVKSGKKGDNAGNPLFVSPVDASGNVFGAFGGGGLAGATGIGSLPFSPGGISNANALFGSGLSGTGGPGAPGGNIFSSIFSKLGSLFGGFLSGGGDVTPGKTYVVGEDHPEFFSPKTAGKIAPSLKFSGSTPPPIVNFVVNGVSDFDSFKRSQPQIAANLAQQLAMANARSR
jgi:hypothetical protein